MLRGAAPKYWVCQGKSEWRETISGPFALALSVIVLEVVNGNVPPAEIQALIDSVLDGFNTKLKVDLRGMLETGRQSYSRRKSTARTKRNRDRMGYGKPAIDGPTDTAGTHTATLWMSKVV